MITFGETLCSHVCPKGVFTACKDFPKGDHLERGSGRLDTGPTSILGALTQSDQSFKILTLILTILTVRVRQPFIIIRHSAVKFAIALRSKICCLIFQRL